VESSADVAVIGVPAQAAPDQRQHAPLGWNPDLPHPVLEPVRLEPDQQAGRMNRPSGVMRPSSTTTLDPTREISVGTTGVSGCGVDGSSAGAAVNADRSTRSPMAPSDASVNDPPTPCPCAQGANARSTAKVLPNRVREGRIGHPSSFR